MNILEINNREGLRKPKEEPNGNFCTEKYNNQNKKT